jgi:hypothetical protein
VRATTAFLNKRHQQNTYTKELRQFQNAKLYAVLGVVTPVVGYVNCRVEHIFLLLLVSHMPLSGYLSPFCCLQNQRRATDGMANTHTHHQ